MNCPIGNHPLVDGVLVKSQRIIRFIQKVVIDFAPREQICRRCYEQAVTTYEDKMKRAIAMHNSKIALNSVSTINTSTNSEDSIASVMSRKRRYTTEKSNISNLEAVAATLAPPSLRVSQEPSTSAAALTNGISVVTSSSSASTAKTVRSRDIRDFLTPVAQQEPSLKDVSQANNGTDKSLNNRPRNSQMPTTSGAAAASSKSSCQDDEVDSHDEPLKSLNYYNGTRLPHVQPILTKKKPRLNHSGSDVMRKYTEDITGG